MLNNVPIIQFYSQTSRAFYSLITIINFSNNHKNLYLHLLMFFAKFPGEQFGSSYQF